MIFLVHLVLLKIGYIVASIQQVNTIFWFALMVTVSLTWVVSYIFIDPIDRFFVARADKTLECRHFQLTNR
jgi:hypothetical protein